MISILRAGLAQVLCLTLVMADSVPRERAEVRARSTDSPVLQYHFTPPAPHSEILPSRQPISEGLIRRPSSRQSSSSKRANIPGQSSTVLPDGRVLLLGGEGKQGPVKTAVIFDPASSALAELPTGLSQARAWQSATLLPDGKVLVFGGIGTSGDVLSAAEVFDPATTQFANLPSLGLAPRAHHTATLLTDGSVFLAGGLNKTDQTVGTAQIFDPRLLTVASMDNQLIAPRSDHTATLQADGTVLVWGGKNSIALALDYGEVYDPAAQTFRIQNTRPAEEQTTLSVTATIPEDGSKNVATNILIAARFSSPIQMQSANNTTVRLTAGANQIDASVVPAEAGMLLFITPQEDLAADTEYDVELNGIKAASGSTLGDFTFGFKTASNGGSQDSSSGRTLGLPTSSSSFGAPENSPYLKLPRLQAPAGETAISGQVLLQNGLPLQGVTLRVGTNAAQSDATGRFLIVGAPAGHGVLVIDGRTANTGTVSYGVFEAGVDVKNRQTNVLDYTNWMPVIDTAHAVTISVPTAQETIVKTPLIPGLEFHLPAGATITDIDGKPANQISITPIPVSQPPFPLPKNVLMQQYFTIQPGGGIISVSNSDGPQGGWLIHPNLAQRKAGTRYHFWDYDPEKKGWYVKGGGSVASDNATVVPDAGVVFNSLAGAAVTCAPIPYNGPNCCGPEDGDPVDLGTGLFVYKKTDLYEPDVIPIELTRVYRQSDPIARDFGVGTWHQYDMFVGSTDSSNCSYFDLFLPGFARIHYTRYLSGVGCGENGSPVPTFVCNTCPGEWFGSTLYWTGYSSAHYWEVYRRDGFTFLFPSGNVPNGTIQNLGLIAIIDPNGNTLSIARDPNTSYITKITSPNGRFINFSYDPNHNLTQVQDGYGRSVQYSYDGNNCLTQVTDANGGVWKYGYQPGYNGPCFMTTITNPRNITYLTNTYDSSARVIKQVQADGGTYLFNYITDPLSNVMETDMTDPLGNVRKVTFNQPPIYYDGYSTGGTAATDTRAAGASIAEATTYQYDPGTYLLTSETDALNRTTSYTYDSAGNLTSVTRLAGTPNQATTNYSYQVQFKRDAFTGSNNLTFTRLAAITDALGNTTSFTYDLNGNQLSVIDPLGGATLFSYDAEGRVVSRADPLGNTTQLIYDGPDLAQVTDSLGRTRTYSNDLFGSSGGRQVSSKDAEGHVTVRQYNAIDRLTGIIDPLGGLTSFVYDEDGNLKTIADAMSHVTSYTYDLLDRTATRQDALLNQETYQYDLLGNRTQLTDRRGKITTYGYDALNRLTFTGYGTQPGPSYESTVGFQYDAGNRLTQATDSVAGSITRGFDGLGRLLSEVTPQGSLSYTYDGAGRRQTMTVAGQPTTNYVFDAGNRLTQLTQASTLVQFGYDSANRRTVSTLPNGLQAVYTFDGASQLTGITYSAGSVVLGTLQYGYSQTGQRISLSGSFASAGPPASTTSAAYNANNQMTQWGGTSLAYDGDGNLINDAVNTYNWNARNQLASISGGTAASFQYDAFGRRFSKAIQGTTTSFLYDGLNIVQELTGSTVMANTLSGSSDEYFVRTDSSGSRVFLTDAMQSTIALTDSTGVLQTTFSYSPFGNTLIAGAPSTNSFMYTGRENDATGLYFYRARYYQPLQGRFISEDPSGVSGGLNLYEYALDDPIDLYDPTGLQGNKPKPPKPSGNAVYFICCQGGQLKVCDKNGSAFSGWVSDCMRNHEQQHVKDMTCGGKNPCAGQPDGALGVSDDEKAPLECSAYRAELECLLPAPRTKEIEGRRDFIKKQIAAYCKSN